MSNPNHPIVVDIDGTLIRTDLFFEGALRLLHRNPLNLFRLAAWAMKGRAIAKARVAQTVDIDPARLPFEPSLLSFLREQKSKGRPLILATAAHRSYAETISAHLGIFDSVIASDVDRNLKGRKKLEAIRQHLGDTEFCYAGDSHADRPIWDAARSGIFVNAPRDAVADAQKHNKAELVIGTRMGLLQSIWKGMRPHQWAKNILVFAPLITSHNYFSPQGLYSAGLAFACFSLCASAVYFINDLLDLDSDRQHPSKKFRPLAAGDLSIPQGMLAGAVLLLTSFALSLLYLPALFSLILGSYFVTTNLYSFYLKRHSTADVITLALLYTVRLFGGAAAIGVALSSWMMGFSFFVFVSLAYLKRYIELSHPDAKVETLPNRGYSAADSETMFSLGVANITAAVVILALFVESEEVARIYQSPELLWALCFLLLFWGNRIWVGARRGKIADDPVVFAIKDRVSQLTGLAFVLVVLAAKFLNI